jgi:hypothetical protein
LSEWTTEPLEKPKEAEPVWPLDEELQAKRPNDIDAHSNELGSDQATSSSSIEIVPDDEKATQITTGFQETQLRRKENKLIKKQRAADARRFAKTTVEDVAAKEKESGKQSRHWRTLLREEPVESREEASPPLRDCEELSVGAG